MSDKKTLTRGNFIWQNNKAVFKENPEGRFQVAFKSKTGVCPCVKPREAFLEREDKNGNTKKIRIGVQPGATCPHCGNRWSEH